MFIDSMLTPFRRGNHVKFDLDTHFSWFTVGQLGRVSVCKWTNSNIDSCQESAFHRQEAKRTADHTHQLPEPYVQKG